MILPNGATVAVIDGSRMRLFRNIGHDPHVELSELPEPTPEEVNTGSGSRHHSSAANPDSRRLTEDDFAAAAAGYLNREVLAGRIGELVVIADPRTLGELRRHFHSALATKLIGELAKDLTGHSVEAIHSTIIAA